MTAWKESRLGDEIELAYGKSLPAHSRVPGAFGVYGSNGQVGSHNEPLIDGPGIIVGRKGSVGAVTFSAGKFWPIDTTYYVVNKGGHDWRYLNYLLLSLGLTGLNSHSAVPGLNREDAYSIPVHIPPLVEQMEIARVLDSLDRGVQLEAEAMAHADLLKDATMRSVFSAGLYGFASKPSVLGDVPAGWDVVEFSSLRESLKYGTSTRCTVTPATYPVLRIPNILSARIDTTDLKYCDLPDREADRYKLHDGDLIFIRTNGVIERLGLCAVYRKEPEGALFASYLIRARLNAGVDPDYVAFFMGSPVGIQLIASRATPAADGKFNLNTGIIDSLQVPLPPFEEQQEISNLLKEIDDKIAIHRRKRAVLEKLRDAVASQLLGGTIRVSDFNPGFVGERAADLQEVVA
jgi:type I restriction enzyme, S subunit